MIAAQIFTLVGLTCVAISGLLLREQLRGRLALRRIFGGLLIAGFCAVLISFVSSLLVARLLCVPMLVGMACVIRGVALEKQLSVR